MKPIRRLIYACSLFLVELIGTIIFAFVFILGIPYMFFYYIFTGKHYTANDFEHSFFAKFVNKMDKVLDNIDPDK